MLYEPSRLSAEDHEVLEQLGARRERLADQIRVPRRWNGNLRRNLIARAIQGSNSIEGYVVETDDAAAAVEGEEPLSADRQTFAEIRGYRQAMSYVLTLAGHPTPSVDAATLRALHFMMLGHDYSKSPGAFRLGPIFVRNERTDETVYTGPDADRLDELVGALVETIDDVEEPLVRAAMAHLNLVMIHPFRDGNGRMARALQTLVLARSGIGEPEFSSIEEWLGANTEDYYRVLAHTGAGAWRPDRSTALWVSFTLRAHHMQSQTVERRIRRSELLWENLEDAIGRLGLPDRAFDALFDAALGYRIRRASYVARTGVQDQTATRDLKAIANAGLFEPRGEKRGRFYVAGAELTSIRDEVTAAIDVPITEPYPNFRVRLAVDLEP